MTQFLAPLFGEFSTDQAIARAAAHQGGIIAKPVLVASSTGSGSTKAWTLALGPNTGLGFWGWKTAWSKDRGASNIIEDANVPIITAQLEPGTGMTRHILIVGRWKWIAGPVGGDGQPLGTLTDNQKAAYEIVQGTDATNPVDPSVTALDAAGRPAVVLARIVFPQGGTPSIEFLPETMLDLAELALKLEGMHRRTGDETHTGRFMVTADPTDDLDVLRKKDKVEGTVKAYASMVNFTVTIPDAWGGGPYPCPIQVASRKSASGTDIQFVDTDLNLVKFTTTGHYLILGQTYSQYNIDNHDMVVEIWRRPVGTTGSSDILIHHSAMPNYSGGIDKPVLCMVNATAGDWIYFKGVGKRSYSAEFVVQFLGVQAATAPLVVTTPDWNGMEASGQVYPKIITIQNRSQNATGSVVWAITGGTAAGFTTLDAAGAMTLNLPSVGTWTLSVSATDALGIPATKTINITLAAYVVIPLVIVNGNYSYEASAYPFAIEITMGSTGGQPPITWSVVVGANTTLPGATMTAGVLTGSVNTAGTWQVESRAIDSAGTPQDVTKIHSISVVDWVDPGDPLCFEASETFILMGDGTGKLLAEVAPGETVKAVHISAYQRNIRTIVDAVVTDKTMEKTPEGLPVARIIEGIKSTPGHQWAVPRDWRRAEDIEVGGTIMRAGDALDFVEEFRVTTNKAGKKPVQMASTLGTRAGSYFVGARPTGPWFLVHNIIMTPSY